MCNLYSQRKPREELRGLFKVGHNRAVEVEPQASIFPGYVAPVVRRADDGDLELVKLSWGFVLPQDGRTPRRVTNARDDKILTSTFWRESFEVRRCLVPATSFCEPAEVTPATWHWFALKGDEPRPPFAFPGIWTRYRGPLKRKARGKLKRPDVTYSHEDFEFGEIEVYAFLTTTPNALVGTINHERMPVLLTQSHEFDQWLNGTTTEALQLAREYPAGRMRIVQEGFEKEDLVLGAAA